MPRVTLEQAYPGIAFRPRTRNWWAWLTRVPPECVHLETEQGWMAALVPDTLYLRGKAARRSLTQRPEVSLCRACLVGVLEAELVAYAGRVVAFEPDLDSFSQYFFVAGPDFEAAGLFPAGAVALEQRLRPPNEACGEGSRPAYWVWVSRGEVVRLCEVWAVTPAPRGRLWPAAGARTP